MPATTKTPAELLAEYETLYRQRAEELLALEKELRPQIWAMEDRLREARERLVEEWKRVEFVKV